MDYREDNIIQKLENLKVVNQKYGPSSISYYVRNTARNTTIQKCT